jgi:signal transduction histidine kinase
VIMRASPKGADSMEWLRQWFMTNQFIVFALYGQVFFTMGVALAVQSMKHTRLELGRHLRWLAAFGLAHGLVEWGYVFIPIQSAYLPPAAIQTLQWLQLLLMILSFACLLQFGLRTAPLDRALRGDAGAITVAAMLITLALALGSHPEDGPELTRIGIEIWVRYLIAVPGALLSMVGIHRASREATAMQVPRISRWLGITAWSLAGYSLLNLVTPEHHHILLAPWLNAQTVFQLLGVPVQIWRTLVGIGLLYGMVRSLSLFAVETDRLILEAQQQKLLEAERELACLNQIAITLGRAREPLLVINEVLGQFMPLLRCSSGAVALKEEEGSRPWTLVAGVGAPQDGAAFWSLVEAVAGSHRPAVRELTEGEWAVGMPIPGARAMLAVAVLSRAHPLALSPQEMQVVDGLGSMLGVALENSRLWAELQRREEDRTRWISRIITAQEDERRRISHELHDDTVQELVLLCRRLDDVEAAGQPLALPVRDGLDAARRQAEELIQGLRNFAHDLRPPAIDELGLVACVHRLLADLALRAGIRWEVRVVGEARRFSRDAEVGLYRIAQEAIRNVEHHAQARSVSVKLEFRREGVCLRVSDDGKGMPPSVWKGGSAASGRLGLLGMQERASLLQGELQIRSRTDRGTIIRVRVPVTPAPAKEEAAAWSASGSY